MVSVYEHLKTILGALEKEADMGKESREPVAKGTLAPDLSECLETLVSCKCLDPGHKEVMKEALRETPPVALACMTVLAKHAEQQALVSEPMGMLIDPEIKDKGSADPKKLAEERYREASNRLNSRRV